MVVAMWRAGGAHQGHQEGARRGRRAHSLGREIGALVKAPQHLGDEADERHHRRSLPPLASRMAASTMDPPTLRR